MGPGRVGQALGKLLAQAGLPVQFVAGRRIAKARRAAKFIGAGRPVSPDAPELTKARLILITTSDEAIASVVRSLAVLTRNWSGKIVLHTSGSLPASVLAALRQRGAAIGSLHPFQTIPSPEAGVRNLRCCFWATEGDLEARREASRLVKALNGMEFRLPPDKKVLYHAAAFLTCPTIVTLMEHSTRLLGRVGISATRARAMLACFVAETALNFYELGARKALTGPVVRGDWAVIRRHIAALRRHDPEVVPAYKALLGAMLRLAKKRPPRSFGKILSR